MKIRFFDHRQSVPSFASECEVVHLPSGQVLDLVAAANADEGWVEREFPDELLDGRPINTTERIDCAIEIRLTPEAAERFRALKPADEIERGVFYEDDLSDDERVFVANGYPYCPACGRCPVTRQGETCIICAGRDQKQRPEIKIRRITEGERDVCLLSRPNDRYIAGMTKPARLVRQASEINAISDGVALVWVKKDARLQAFVGGLQNVTSDWTRVSFVDGMSVTLSPNETLEVVLASEVAQWAINGPLPRPGDVAFLGDL